MIGPARGQDRSQPGFGELEPFQLTLEANSFQIAKKGERRRQDGGREKDHPGVAGWEGDVDLDRIPHQPGRCGAGGLQ